MKLPRFSVKKLLLNLTIYQKLVALALVLNIIAQSSPLIDPATFLARTDIFSSRNQGQELVLVLVEDSLMQDSQAYDGLRRYGLGSLSARDISSRIERYANTIQSKLNNTKVEIVTVSKLDSPVKVASLLKQAYNQNLEEYRNRKLAGTILVGDVPLPVVNKSGNRFVSMYPYTDFEDPAFYYNPDSNLFEPTLVSLNQDFEPEIWHGVIDFDSADQFANFFDKNHLYHQGVPEFSQFQEKIFYSEPIHEAKSFDPAALLGYQKFQTYQQELIYNRFSQKLFNQVSSFSLQDLQDFYPPNQPGGPELISSEVDLASADISMKDPIETQLQSVLEVFQSSLSKQVDAISGTGRYAPADIFTPITAIAQNDDYQGEYYRLINQLLETRIDQIVNRISTKFIIPKAAQLSGVVTFRTTSGTETRREIEPIKFINNSPDPDWLDQFVDDLDLETKAEVLVGLKPLSTAIIESTDFRDIFLGLNQMSVYGTPVAEITSANQCRIYRGGGTDNPLDKTVKTARGVITNQTPVCFLPSATTPNFNIYNPEDAGKNYLSKNYCSDFFAKDLNEPYRTQAVEEVNFGALTHEACFNMRPVADFNQILDLKYTAAGNPQSYAASNESIDSSQIRIQLDGTSQSLVLADILENFDFFQDRDVTDWNAWSYYLLGNPVSTQFVIENPANFSNISKIELQVSKLQQTPATRQVSSVVKHVDPTDQMLQAVVDGQVTQDLPINATRYVTFLDSEGVTQKIEYPNIFNATSLAEFLQTLETYEQKFSQLSTQNLTGTLTSVFVNGDDAFSSDFSQIQNVSRTKLDYFINWKGLSINQKYSQVYRTFLNSNNPLKFESFPNSFEIAVITANSDDLTLDLSVATDLATEVTPTETATIVELDQQLKQEQNERRTQARQQQSFSAVQNTCASPTQTISATDWFTEYIPCWIDSLSDLGTEFIPATRLELSTYAEAIANPDSEVSAISIQSVLQNYSSANHETADYLLKILDSNGTKIVGKPVMVDLTVSGVLSTEGLIDADPIKPGVQIFMASGEVKISLPIQQAGAARLRAAYQNLVADENVRIHSDLKINSTIIGNPTAARAGSTDKVRFEIVMQNQANQELSFQPPKVTLANPAHGKIELVSASNPSNKFEYEFSPGTVSAQALIKIEYPTLNPIQQEINVLPSTPAKLYFKELEIDAKSGSIQAELYLVDTYGNRLLTNLSQVQLSSSNSAKLNISQPEININQGVATIQQQVARNQYGSVYLTASKPGLKSAILKINFQQNLALADFDMFASPALYYELRTATSGLKQAQNILANGKAQAVSTLTTSVSGKAPVLYINSFGAPVAANNQVQLKYTLLATPDGYKYSVLDNSNQEIVWGDFKTINLPAPVEIETLSEINTQGVYYSNLEPNTNVFKFTDSNQIELLTPTASIDFVPSSQYLTVNILNESKPVAQVFYAVSGDNLQISRNLGNTKFDLAQSSVSSGIVVYDNNSQLSAAQKPQSSLNRADKALTNPNQGLTEDGKSILLFSAGMSAGESNRPYLSEAGVLLGDPVISLNPKPNSTSNFNQDIGKLIARADSDISHILNYQDQVLIADKLGNISRIDLEEMQFSKNLIRIPNGIKSIIESKISSRSSSLMVLADKSCNAEDTCMYELQFNSDDVVTIPLEVSLPTKAVQIHSFDFDNDNDDDLLVLGENNFIYLFERAQQGLTAQPNIIGNVYDQLQSDNSFLDSLLVSTNSEISNQDLNATKLNFELATPVQTARGLQTNQTQDFYALKQVAELSASTVRIQDLNSELLRNNDRIRYTLNLNSEVGINNASLSFLLDPNQKLDRQTLLPTNLSFTETLNSQRPLVISGINIPASGSQQITFETVYTKSSATEPPLIYIVQNEADTSPDSFPDIKIVITGTNKVIYYHSQFDTTSNIFRYERKLVDLPVKELDLVDSNTQNVPGASDTSDSANQGRASFARDLQRQGRDRGTPIGSPTASINELSDSIGDELEALRCDGPGCIITPINRAFLVPTQSVVLPAFGWGCPSVIPIWPPTPFESCAGGRQYFSPTLTGELVGATCIGPYMTAACWTYKLGNLGAACDAINSYVDDVITDATSFVSDGLGAVSGGLVVVGGAGSSSGTNVSVPGFPALFTDWITNQLQEITSKLLDLPDLTIIYPSIDSLVGYFEPVDEQASIEQFQNVGYLGIEDALAKLSSMPLFDVEINKHQIKYPWIPSGDEFNKYQVQFAQILEQNMQEVKSTLESWGCYSNRINTFSEFNLSLKNSSLRAEINNAILDNPDLTPIQAEACLQLAGNFEGFYLGFTANLDALKQYRDLPKNIFAVENFVADYANQVVTYAEVVLDRTAGYLVQNTQALNEWQKFLVDIQNLIDDFRVIIDFSISFMNSCDDCQTDRTNLDLNFLFEKLFQFPGEIPVLEFPKLPDITLDFSKVEAGIEIVLPSFEFVPERIALPDLNTFIIDLPDAIPLGFNFDFGRFGLSPVVTLPEPPDIEQYILDLPPLGDLEIPVLPSLPRPPEIGIEINDFIADIEPSLDALSSLLRLVCIIYKGVVPVPEGFLKTKIESMTNRPLTPILPIDLSASFQFPQVEYSYISEYKFILESYFNLDFDILDTYASDISERFNQVTEKTKQSIDAIIDRTLPPIRIDLSSISESQTARQELYQKIPTEFELVATVEKLSKAEVLAYKPKNLNKLPDNLKVEHQKLLAFKKQLTKSSELIASTNNPSQFVEKNSDKKLIARTIPDFNQFPTRDTQASTYAPVKGIYYQNPNSVPPNKVEKLVAYSFESNKPTVTAFVDIGQNNAVDILYSKGDQLFLKTNLSNPPVKKTVSGSISVRSIDTLTEVSAASIYDVKVDTNTQNRQALFALPEVLQDQIVLIDIYNAQLTDTEQVARYIVNSKADQIKHSTFTKVSTFSANGFVLPKDNFSEIYQRDQFTTSVLVPLENKNYRATISLFNANTGKIEILQKSLPITPNICKDNVPPVFDSTIAQNLTVGLYQPVTLDFTSVYDLGSEIQEIYLDTNLNLDSNSDGDSTNDKDLSRNSNSLIRKFILPGFTTTGSIRLKAWAVDEAKNKSSIEIRIQVVPPQISLNPSITNFSGSVNPPVGNLPVAIIRERDGQIEQIFETTTNADGNFSTPNLNTSDSLVIKDETNQTLFEINNQTGSLKRVSNDANITVRQPQAAGQSTTLLLKKGDQTITTLQKVSDINQDVQIVPTRPSKATLANSSNVFVIDENTADSFLIEAIPGSDQEYAGGARIMFQGQQFAILDTSGGIKLLNPNLQIRLQSLTDLTEFQAFQLFYNNQFIASVIPTFATDQIKFTVPEVAVRTQRPPLLNTPATPAVTAQPDFQDVTGPNASIIKYLQENGVIDGIERDGQRFFEPARQINRAEYSKIILNILCIVPSAESFLRPSVFSDIPFSNNLAWYYSFTKETQLQKIFTGYLGEIDSITNLPPFKPANSITRAEATKVILEALVNTNVINLDEISVSSPWYESYIQVAQDITPYLNSNIVTNQTFILTEAEAANPNQLISREEFAVMAFRVLSLKNCIEQNPPRTPIPPTNQSAQSTADSATSNTNAGQPEQAPAAPSSNLPSDATNQPSSLVSNAGIYMQQLSCLSCPCQYRYEYLATVRKNDIVYAVIRDPNTQQIIQKSSPLNY